MSNEITQNQKQVALIIALAFWVGIAWLALRNLLSDQIAQIEAWRLFSYAIALIIAVVAISVGGYALYRLSRKDDNHTLPG